MTTLLWSTEVKEKEERGGGLFPVVVGELHTPAARTYT